MIFFYENEDLTSKSPEIVSQKLKSSLSQTLTHFYPLAGRIEGVSINCNNEGAVYTEAYTDLLLSDYLNNLYINSLNELFPKISSGEESPGTWPLLSVQANFFGSGSGVAVAVCLSHKICDASSLSTFVQTWAATARGESNNDMSTPQFAGTTIFPPPDSNCEAPSLDAIITLIGKCIAHRFVFPSSKIKELKHKAASESVQIPTRVEVISSLIWKCAAKACNFNLVAPKPSTMMQAMDLRLRIPSNVLPKNAIGNLQTALLCKRGCNNEFEIRELVADFRKAKEAVNEMIKTNLEDDDTTTFGLKLLSGLGGMLEFDPNATMYTTTSWCRKDFYQVDFGWGRPTWVGTGSHTLYESQAYTLLMDAEDGESIEAWIGLPEKDMLAFVCDQELLSYASLNPPIII